MRRHDAFKSQFPEFAEQLTAAKAEIERLEAERHEAYRKGLGFALSALDSVSHDNPMTANDVADVIRAEIEKVGGKDWCVTMGRPRSQCGCPDCGSSLTEFNP